MSKLLTAIAEFFALWRFSRMALVIFMALMLFALWKFFNHKSTSLETYVTASVERADIETLVTATGVLQPREYVDVGAQVSGQLKKLHVVVGQEVATGDLLAEIDATVFRAKVDGIRAQLRNQQAQLGDKEAQLELAKIRKLRQQNLFKDEATPQESLQVAEANYKSAEAQLHALQAQIAQTESSLRAEEANLAYARIYAPMSGTVVSMTARQGQTLNANNQAPTIMRIADLSSMTVQTQVSEADIGKLHLGMPVYFTTLGGQDFRWYSKLDRVEPTPQVSSNVVLYNALFEVPNEQRSLMTSMSAQVFFIAARARDTLIIPASAVNFKLPKQDETNKETDTSDKLAMSAHASSTSDKSSSISADLSVQNGSKPLKNSTPGDTKSAEQESLDVLKEHKRGDRKNKLPSANDQVELHTATVQVMDEKGNLSQRKVTLGISNRVRVQVVEGLQLGEKVVSGLRQQEKPATSNSAMVGGAAGMGAAGPNMGSARQMR